jgi:hypothetical protein
MKVTALCVLLTLGFVNLLAQSPNCKIWDEFVAARKNGTTSLLPDFSYAGYKFSEQALPSVTYKMFSVIDFGAVPNDGKSDKAAIQKAIAAAEKNGEGVVFFPRGRYLVNTEDDDNSIIKIASSKLVLRGEGSGSDGSILFFERDLPPADSTKLWTTPYAIQTDVAATDKKLTQVVADAASGSSEIEVAGVKEIKPGDWIVLVLKSNNKDLVNRELSPKQVDEKWTSILQKGVVVNERHLVKEVNGHHIVLHNPIYHEIEAEYGWSVNRFAHISQVGFENLAFEGNWLKEFVHHRSVQDDGGWSILKFSRTVNAWVKDCSFRNVSRAVDFSQSAAGTAFNILITGHVGHNAVSVGGGSTGILVARVDDQAGMWHASGVSGGSSTGNVFWRCTHTPSTSFESHASQPRFTLFDNIKGGFFLGRAGGALQNLPNHGRYLVLWNYEETDAPEQNFEFWSSKTWYWKIVPPVVVGFHGAGTTFKQSDVAYEEGNGEVVSPVSLFEAQLKLRLGKLPQWMEPYR